MGYLAFDRDAVDTLRLALQRSIDALGSMRLTDAAARTSAQRIDRAVRDLSGWTTTMRGITACVALAEYRPVGKLDGADPLAAAIEWMLDDGRQVVTDPLGNGIGDPYLAAQSVGVVLHDVDIEDLSTGELERISRLLDEVLTTDAGRWGFLNGLRGGDLAELFARFQHAEEMERHATQGEPSEKLAALATVLGHIGFVHGEVADTADLDLDGILGDLEPYIAAQVLAGMDLPPAEFGRLAYDVIARDLADPYSADDALVTYIFPPLAADILFPVIAPDAERSREFTRQTLSGDLDVLLASADEARSLVGTIVFNNLDPELTDPRAAGTIVIPILEHLVNDPDLVDAIPDRDLAWTGELLLRFPFNFAGDFNDWEGLWGPALSQASLLLIINNDEAMKIVNGGAAAIYASLGDLLGTAPMPTGLSPTDQRRWMKDRSDELVELLTNLQELEATLATLTRNDRIHDAERALDVWTTVVGTVISLLAGGAVTATGAGPIAGILVGEGANHAAGAATLALAKYFSDHHLPFAPPDLAQVASDTATTVDRKAVVLTAVMLAAAYDYAVTMGFVAPGSPPPPPDVHVAAEGAETICNGVDYSEQIDAWLETVRFIDGNDSAGRKILDAARAMNTGAIAAEHCADILNP